MIIELALAKEELIIPNRIQLELAGKKGSVNTYRFISLFILIGILMGWITYISNSRMI